MPIQGSHDVSSSRPTTSKSFTVSRGSLGISAPAAGSSSAGLHTVTLQNKSVLAQADFAYRTFQSLLISSFISSYYVTASQYTSPQPLQRPIIWFSLYLNLSLPQPAIDYFRFQDRSPSSLTHLSSSRCPLHGSPPLLSTGPSGNTSSGDDVTMNHASISFLSLHLSGFSLLPKHLVALHRTIKPSLLSFSTAQRQCHARLSYSHSRANDH